MSRFVLDEARALTAFAADAGGTPRRTTAQQLFAANKDNPGIVRQCPVWGEPFTFVAAQDRLALARAGWGGDRTHSVQGLAHTSWSEELT